MFTIQGSTMVAKEIRLSANAIGKMAPGAHSTGEGIPGSSRSDPGMRRRELLISTAMTLVFSATSARALVVKGSLPWAPNAGLHQQRCTLDHGCISLQRKALRSKRSSTG